MKNDQMEFQLRRRASSFNQLSYQCPKQDEYTSNSKKSKKYFQKIESYNIKIHYQNDQNVNKDHQNAKKSNLKQQKIKCKQQKNTNNIFLTQQSSTQKNKQQKIEETQQFFIPYRNHTQNKQFHTIHDPNFSRNNFLWSYEFPIRQSNKLQYRKQFINSRSPIIKVTKTKQINNTIPKLKIKTLNQNLNHTPPHNHFTIHRSKTQHSSINDFFTTTNQNPLKSIQNISQFKKQSNNNKKQLFVKNLNQNFKFKRVWEQRLINIKKKSNQDFYKFISKTEDKIIEEYYTFYTKQTKTQFNQNRQPHNRQQQLKILQKMPSKYKIKSKFNLNYQYYCKNKILKIY